MSSGGAAPPTAWRILGATLNYGLASYIPRLVNFLLLPIYAVFLSPREMGMLELCIALDVLLGAVSRLGLPGAMARAYFDHRAPDALADLVTTTAVALMVSALVSGGVTLVFAPVLLPIFAPDLRVFPEVALVVATSTLRLAPELQSRLLQATEQSRLAATLNVGMSLFGTVAKVSLVAGLRMGVAGALLAELATAAVGAAIAVLRHRNEIRGHVRRPILKQNLTYGVPLVPHVVAAWLSEFGGRSVMAAMGVMDAVGQLAVAGRLVSPIQVATAAFVTAFGPIYFRWRTDLAREAALGEIRRAASGALTVTCILGLGASVFGPLVLLYVLPAGYRGASPACGLLASSLVVRVMYNIMGMELMYAKKTARISLVFILTSVVTLGLTRALVPSFSTVGAAMAQCAGTIVGVGLTAVLTGRDFPRPISGQAVRVTALVVLISSGGAFLFHGGAFWIELGVAVLVLSFGGLLVMKAYGVTFLTLRTLWTSRSARAGSRVRSDSYREGA